MSAEAASEQAVRPPAAESAGPAVGLRGVRRTYGSITAVDDLTLDIPDGEFFALIGPSGCGKTTTLRILAGLEEPTEGEVWLHNKDVTFVPPHRRPVSTVFQNYALFPHLNVFENVAFGLRERKLPKPQIAERVREMLELVDLTGREDVRPAHLSGGQQQRVALARSLVLEPEVLLLDEPLGALDLKLRRQMQLLLKRIQRKVGITFIYVTHDQEEAFSMSDRVAVMNQGRLEQLGSPELVYRCPETMFVADFVGSTNRFPGRIAEVLGTRSYAVELDGIGRTEMRGVTGLHTGVAGRRHRAPGDDPPGPRGGRRPAPHRADPRRLVPRPAHVVPRGPRHRGADHRHGARAERRRAVGPGHEQLHLAGRGRLGAAGGALSPAQATRKSDQAESMNSMPWPGRSGTSTSPSATSRSCASRPPSIGKYST